ncbi:MAG: response regulator [Anaerolineae bacterium]|nr:response regulator [Anaerolineae bacterium]
MNKLLVVEDETITSDMLRRYFEIVGYEVIDAATGGEAVKQAVEHQPKVIILDINLPDIDGYEVCKRLRSEQSTRHIPIIFLTCKDDRRDRLIGLELGADDFLTKPFDIEELRLRVHNIIGRMGGIALVDARTSLPSTTLIQERLPKLLNDPDSVFMDIEIEHMDAFGQGYGPVATNQAIRSTAKIIGDLLHEVDPMDSFLGHPNDSHFLLGIRKQAAERVKKELPTRFHDLRAKFYTETELERGSLIVKGQPHPLMGLKLTHIDGNAMQSLLGVQFKVEAKPKAATEEQKKPEKPSPPKAKKEQATPSLSSGSAKKKTKANKQKS